MIDTATFEQNRRMLFGIAYRMLGSVADAEDLVQDTWLRCSQVSTRVENPAGYLARTVTNLALNRLTSAAVTRERYVGPWLPEPLVTRPDTAEDVELAESVSLAMLVVLESLSPLERAVFVLKEVFGFSFTEIAGMLERSEASVRQVGRRARTHVQERRPRYDTPDEVRRRVTDEFLAACVGGDLNRVMELLAPDVTAWSDGGGKVQAALHPQRGADKVARFFTGVLAKLAPGTDAHPVLVNGRPGLLFTVDGRPDTVTCAEIVDGRITQIHAIRNPDKLRHVEPIG
ncbi:RNA polymerase sigma-70 factor [Streptomyces yaizuensis]|uniref:RNA polymerase sigma-70 factor n=1 Tax=Streptomyces yaizuensis TaxID=2989713 RepID=A0ABQ5NXD2_9ACTN|nr:RNA polymerase sigma-70 factor [Streptomyces sp. YSPA8]GLF94897.1 RNA polymerase sigma-70 factor [Streptomyces sp. YSPA8]